MFSSVVSTEVFLNWSLSDKLNESTIEWISILEKLTPCVLAWNSESVKLISEVNWYGIITAWTFSEPIASTATAKVNAESIPPDRPIKAPPKEFFWI